MDDRQGRPQGGRLVRSKSRGEVVLALGPPWLAAWIAVQGIGVDAHRFAAASLAVGAGLALGLVLFDWEDRAETRRFVGLLALVLALVSITLDPFGAGSHLVVWFVAWIAGVLCAYAVGRADPVG